MNTAAAAPARLEPAQLLQARFIAQETPKSLLIGMASAWLLAAGMWGGQPDADYALRAFGWAGVISLLLLRGCVIARGVQRAAAAALPQQFQRLRRNALALACLWGGSAALLLPGSDLEHQMLLVAAIAMITMGGAIGRAAHERHMPWFVMITTGLFSAGLLALPGRFQLFIGLGFLLFGGVVALFTRAQGNALQRERELAVQLEHAREEAEAARQQAERASAAKTRFLAAASHDLRQPMHAIGLLVGLMHARAAPHPDIAQLAQKAEQSVLLMEALFGSLLDISKLDAGAVQPDWGPVRMSELLAQLEQAWAPQAAARGLRLRMRPTALVVHSDATLLARIAHNLVANALGCTQRGGVLVACRQHRGGLELQVWDTGPGVPEDQQAAIFEEFVRIARPGDGNRGLGLGLAIVQRSAQLLGQGVRLASWPGRGSCFAVGLQRAKPGAAEALARAAAATRASGPGPVNTRLQHAFVALVAHDETVRETTTALLQGQGCRVVSAPDATALRRTLGAHLRAPDLLIVDLAGGASASSAADTLLQGLRSDHETELPALLLSAGDVPATAAAGAATARTVLRKPVAPERLLREAAALVAAAAALANERPRTAAPAAAASQPAPSDPAGADGPSSP